MREPEHPRSESVDLEAAALLLVRRVYSQSVRMIGHDHPISVRLWELISAETGSSPASQQVESRGEAALFGGWRK